MFKFFGKIVALIESLISVIIPLASPTPTLVAQSPTPIPVVETTESPTPFPIEIISEPVETFSPSPTPTQDLLNNLIIQLNQLKQEIAAYTPEPTPAPQIIYIVQTPIPTPTPVFIPVSTPTTTPTPTPIPKPYITIRKSDTFGDVQYKGGSINVKLGEFILESNGLNDPNFIGRLTLTASRPFTIGGGGIGIHIYLEDKIIGTCNTPQIGPFIGSTYDCNFAPVNAHLTNIPSPLILSIYGAIEKGGQFGEPNEGIVNLSIENFETSAFNRAIAPVKLQTIT